MGTDEDLALLRNRVIHLEGRLAFLYRHLGVTFEPEAAPGDDPRIIEALQRGNPLDAIKVYRTIHRNGTITIGLDQAKAAVEEIKGRLGL